MIQKSNFLKYDISYYFIISLFNIIYLIPLFNYCNRVCMYVYIRMYTNVRSMYNNVRAKALSLQSIIVTE